MHWPSNTPVRINNLAERQEIPLRYLVQILIQLKRTGLVRSTRGKRGGYNLAKPPDRIRLGEVVRGMSGPLLPVANESAGRKTVFSGIWGEVEEAMAKILDQVTFEDICNKARGVGKNIIYQI